MNKGLLIILAVAAFAGVPALYAEDVDPMARNLIFAEGEAEVTVPVNGVDLQFGYDVEKGSFEETERESARIAEKMGEAAKALGVEHYELLKGWDLVKQARISLASKGRRISNRVTLRVTDFPAGKLHELTAALIDRSLKIDGAVALENVRVFVTEALEQQKRSEAVTSALKALQENAAKAAQALGRPLSAPKRVFLSSGEGGVQPMADTYMPGSAPREMMAQSFVSVQKSFNVEAEIADRVKFSARVNGVYQLD